MEEVKKQGRPAKKKEGLPIYQKIRLEVTGIKGGKKQFSETTVMRECQLSDKDAVILNSQEKNSLIRYKKK